MTSVGKTEARWQSSISRRRALAALTGLFAGSPLLRAQHDPIPLKEHRRLPGLREMTTAFDFELIFRGNVPRYVYNYTAHGADSEFTLRRNREAFDWVDIVPRQYTTIDSVSTQIEILGIKLDCPILVAPTGGQAPLHPSAEAGMHVGASGANTTMIVASNPSVPLDQIAAAASGPLWYQHYPLPDEDARRRLLDSAHNVGAKAIVVTVDGRSNYFERDLHDRHLGGNVRPAAAPRVVNNPYRAPDIYPWFDTTSGWKYIDQIRPLISIPMFIKGILTAEDARLAVERGANGIVVSNHGGRILDYAPSTLEVLPEIVDAVGGRVPVLIDSGFRRGSDVFKALALGARGVLLGRASRWGLGAFGPPGVQRVLEIIRAELIATMKAAGQPTIESIDRTAVRTRFS